MNKPTDPRFVDKTGARFSRLVVLSYEGRASELGKRGRHLFWRCICDCGKSIIVSGSALDGGVTGSCGCLRADTTRMRSTIHGDTKSKEYRIWAHMIRRAHRGSEAAKDYVERGIRVCDRWLTYTNFLEDMGRCPEKCSIDRIDNNKGYSPENCRWANAKQQARNRRSNIVVEINGEKMCLLEACEKSGLPYKYVLERISRYGDSFKSASERCAASCRQTSPMPNIQ